MGEENIFIDSSKDYTVILVLDLGAGISASDNF